MPFYAGFDTNIYPGDAQLDWLKANTNLVWCGFYLAPAPSHGDESWMGKQAYLSENGWGVLPVYLGQQTSGPGSHNVNGAQGSLDGANAASLAQQAGFPAGSSIFLDIEDGSALSANATAYIQAWGQALQGHGYAQAFYCSHNIAASVAAAMSGLNLSTPARIWPYKVTTTAAHTYTGAINAFPETDPAGSGYANACAWQREQNLSLNLPGAPVTTMVIDLSTANLPDPGAPSSQG